MGSSPGSSRDRGSRSSHRQLEIHAVVN
jgi:hypothetical protein